MPSPQVARRQPWQHLPSPSPAAGDVRQAAAFVVTGVSPGDGTNPAMAVAAVMRQVGKQLQQLNLHSNEIGDEGLAAILAANSSVTKLLDTLWLNNNPIGDDGCAALAAALRGGTWPKLMDLRLRSIPASKQATEAVRARRGRLRPSRV